MSYPTLNYMESVKEQQGNMVTLLTEDLKAVTRISQLHDELNQSEDLTDDQNQVVNIALESLLAPRGISYSKENLGLRNKLNELKGFILKIVDWIRTRISNLIEWINKKLFKTQMRRNQLRKSLNKTLSELGKDKKAVYTPTYAKYEVGRCLLRGGELTENLEADLEEVISVMKGFRNSPVQRVYGEIVAKTQTFLADFSSASEDGKKNLSQNSAYEIHNHMLSEWIPANKDWQAIVSLPTADMESVVIDELIGMKSVVRHMPSGASFNVFRENMQSGYELTDSVRYRPEHEGKSYEFKIFDYETGSGVIKTLLKLMDELDDYIGFFKDTDRSVSRLDKVLEDIVRTLATEQKSDPDIAGFLFYVNALIRTMNNFPIDLYIHGLSLATHLDGIYRFMVEKRKAGLSI